MRQRMMLAMIVLLLAAIGSADAVRLTYRDPANTTRWYKTEITMDGSFDVPEMDEPLAVKGTVQFTSSEKVTAVNTDGTAKVTAEITDGQLNLSVGEQDVTQSLTGYKVSFKRSLTGKITEVKVEGTPEGDFNQMQTLGFGQQWKMISGIGQGIEFPANDLDTGAKWTNKSTVVMGPGQNVTLTMNNVLKGAQQVEGLTLMSVDSDTTLKMPVTKITLPVAGQNFTIEQSSSLTGKSNTLFNPAAGEITGTSFNGNLKMTMTMPGIGDEQPMVMSGTVAMTGKTQKIPEPKKSD